MNFNVTDSFLVYYIIIRFIFFSLGGHQPYVPVGLADDETKKNLGNNYASGNSHNNQQSGGNNEWKQRARVLCSYDARDSTELNLNANEV